MRRRILLLVVGMTTLVVLAFAIPVTVLTRKAVAQAAQNAANAEASVIAGVLRNQTATPAEISSYLKRETADSGFPISVRTPDGQLLGSTPADDSSRLPHEGGRSGIPPQGGDGRGPLPDGDHDLQPQEVTTDDGVVALASAPAPDHGLYSIRVFLSNTERYEGATGWYLLIAAGSLALLLIGVGAGELLTRRITRPLVRTAHTAQQLSVGNTTARAPTEGPREIADVGKALNRLADRIDQLIAEERETVADLSHRLRTPLTTLRLDAEALRDPSEAERVGGHVGDLERMLTAVIHAARRPQREGRMPSCDATAVVGKRVEFWSALTDEQGRPREVVLPPGPLPVRASAEDLAAAVDALLENVVAHTAEGTRFAVRLVRIPSGARLEIADDGSGIPAAAEVRGRSDRGSSGLGLDIARRCAEAAGGSMTISSSPSGGALVTVLLPAP
jgi:signal transduction histidine kinase